MLFQSPFLCNSSVSEQLGIKLRGTAIEEIVIGGAAHISMKLSRGDVILKVDGVVVTDSSVHKHLVGSNFPRSPVIITVANGGAKVKAYALAIV